MRSEFIEQQFRSQLDHSVRVHTAAGDFEGKLAMVGGVVEIQLNDELSSFVAAEHIVAITASFADELDDNKPETEK